MPDNPFGERGVWASRRVGTEKLVGIARTAEELGYGAVWVGGGGEPGVFDLVSAVLDATTGVKVASGIANIWVETPESVTDAWHRLEDAHVRGLLTLLADDERLVAFSDRELDRLRRADERYDGRLEQALRALLDHPANKTAAAARLAVSRPVLYERLAQVEQALGVDLDDGETRTSLHLALLVADARARARQPDPLVAPTTG